MPDERSTAGFSESSDDIDHAGRQSAVREIPGKLKSGERSLLSGLQHTSTACGDGGRKLPCRHQERIVPWNNLSRDSDRFLERKRHGVIGNGIDITDNFGGKAAIIFEAGSSVGDVVFGFDDGLASV